MLFPIESATPQKQHCELMECRGKLEVARYYVHTRGGYCISFGLAFVRCKLILKIGIGFIRLKLLIAERGVRSLSFSVGGRFIIIIPY